MLESFVICATAILTRRYLVDRINALLSRHYQLLDETNALLTGPQ
jgi:hypothetical protein